MSADRAGYTAGLRALADLLDAHPEVPLPFEGSSAEFGRLSIHHLDADRDAFLATVRAFPGLRSKSVRDAGYFDVQVDLHGLHLDITTYRDTVCERVVTGTREVTREVPDPDALAAIPTTTVTETVEDVEWVCAPLLAPVTA